MQHSGSMTRSKIMAGLTVALSSMAPINTGTLLRQTIDLHHLTHYPRPAYKTVQFSSYDRESSLPGGPGWFANSDGFGGESIPNFVSVVKAPGPDGIGEYLVCDVEGPGAIVRTWTAAISGSVRMYLDGSDKPIFDGTADEFFRNPWRPFMKDAGLEQNALDNGLMQRDAAYCPIPFAKRCRIVWTGKIPEIHFYHINISLFEKGTPVTTFTPADLKTYADDIKNAVRILREPTKQYAYTSTKSPIAINATLAPGERKDVLVLNGQQAIERLTLKVAADDVDNALRQTILNVICDDYPWGQVQSPIGDFFGAAPGINPMDTLPLTVEPDGTMTCRYVMPFEKSMRIMLVNRGKQTVTVTGDALPMDYKWDPDTSMHFRARWRTNHDLTTGQPPQDIPILLATGKGVYVGTAIYLLNPCAAPTPGGGWWGEGDEKVFIDNETFPSTFGTGSEDYFNYSWSADDIFIHAYCGQPRNDGPGNRGFVTNFRWHIADPMPFADRLSFYIELFSHNPTPGLSYARIGYHYARPGLMDDQLEITDEDVRPLDLPANWEPAPIGGATGTTFHSPEDIVVAGAPIHEEKGNLWSGSRLMVWEPKSVGDEISFTIPVAEAGKNALVLGVGLTDRGGTVSVKVDGKTAFEIDLHVPYRVLLRQLSSEPSHWTKGDHKVTFRCEALAPTGATAIGIDYLGTQKR